METIMRQVSPKLAPWLIERACANRADEPQRYNQRIGAGGRGYYCAGHDYQSLTSPVNDELIYGRIMRAGSHLSSCPG